MSRFNPELGSFAIGTVLRNKVTTKIGVVTDVSVNQNDIEYAWEGCAWYTADCFDFISHPTKKSLQKVYEIYREKYDGEEDDNEYF